MKANTKFFAANSPEDTAACTPGQACKVEYSALRQTILIEDPNMTLLEAAVKNRIPHMQECGGNGRCTTCRVKILEGHQNVAPRNELESRLAKLRGWDPSVRLACQTKVNGPVKLERQIKTFSEISRLQEEMVKSGKGEEKELAILFCDMRNFTPFVEGNMAYDVVHILNRFFSALGEAILMNNGLIYQYVGDEIVGVFGLDSSDKMHSCLAAGVAALVRAYYPDLTAVQVKDILMKSVVPVNQQVMKPGTKEMVPFSQLSVSGGVVNVYNALELAAKTKGKKSKNAKWRSASSQARVAKETRDRV